MLLGGAESDRLTCGRFTLKGRFGLIRERGRKVVALHLAGGTELAAGELKTAGTNHVFLCDPLSAAKLRELIGEGTEWAIYEYGVEDGVLFDSSASLQVQ